MRWVEKHRALVITGALLLAFSCGCAVGMAGMENVIESEVAEAAEEMGAAGQEDENTVSSGEQEKLTVSYEVGVGGEEALAKSSLESADYYLETMPDAPLLSENADSETIGYAGSSLETDINDVNATYRAGDIIRKLCKENGIDVNKATVSDLTKEQIAWIDMETFRQSEHGK